MRLINDSPRVEGNNIIVDIDTDHPVRCGIRLAAMASPLRDCESIHEYSQPINNINFICLVQELALIISSSFSNEHYYCCSRYLHSHFRLYYYILAILKHEV